MNANASTVSKDAARQPSTSTSTHTGFAAGTPKIDDAPRSAAARAAVHAEFIKQHRARTRLGNPAFSTPVISGPVNGHVKSPAEQLSQVTVITLLACVASHDWSS